MMKINYNDKEHIFHLDYDLLQYIPDTLYQKYPEYTELHFVQELFANDRDIEFIDSVTEIWSICFHYKYLDKVFSLVLDEDYSFISYAADDPKDRKEIAEHICELIMEAKSKHK